MASDRTLADWPLRLYEHRGGREWSTDDHGDLWKHAGSVEVVPASQIQGAAEALAILNEAMGDAACADWPDDVRAYVARAAAALGGR